jgi:hypothetical protein
MALPFSGPLIQALQRDKLHMKDIDAVLDRLRKDFAAGLHAALRAKYIEILETSRKEKDIE